MKYGIIGKGIYRNYRKRGEAGGTRMVGIRGKGGLRRKEGGTGRVG